MLVIDQRKEKTGEAVTHLSDLALPPGNDSKRVIKE